MSCSEGVEDINKEKIAMNKMLSYRPPRIALVCLAAAVGLHYLSPPETILYFPYHFLGTLFGIAGFSIMMWAWVLFQQRKTVVCIVLPTGQAAQATTLIQSGPYRFTRNPMYLGMALMLCGAGFFLGSVAAFLAPLAFSIIVNEVFIPFEERNMEQTFNEEYRHYRERVRRWI
jgi:protein-S-isoprenylcysteine O-methyltransferase Ste14